MGSASTSTTTAWSPPPALTGFSATVNDGQSYISLDWDNSTQASGFDYYAVYRRVTGATTWSVLTTIKNQNTSNYNDYSAGQLISYDYKVTQFEAIPGNADLESPDSPVLSVNLTMDTWFVIGADFDVNHIFELPVSQESHTRPIQQEVFQPVGSTRKTIARGNVLGYEGSLTVTWMDSERTTALTQVEYLCNNAGPHILKSPFGDVWYVEFSSPTYTYKGGGNVDVTLPWIAVD